MSTVWPAASIRFGFSQSGHQPVDERLHLGIALAELGPLAAPAHVVIDEIPATDWGYDGLPQASHSARRL